MRRRGSRGRGVRQHIDQARLAAAAQRPGQDTRIWVAYAEVATVHGEEGVPDFADPQAVVVTPAGVEVDLVVQPHGYPLTARHGIAAGGGYVCTPIHPGDQVIVLIPDGDLMAGAEVLRVIPSAGAPVPLGDDRKPLFQNDRVLIVGRSIPIDLRVEGSDARVLLGTDGSVKLGDGASHPIPQGDLQRSALNAFLTVLSAYAGAIQSIADPTTLATAALNEGINALKSASYLSPKNKTT